MSRHILYTAERAKRAGGWGGNGVGDDGYTRAAGEICGGCQRAGEAAASLVQGVRDFSTHGLSVVKAISGAGSSPGEPASASSTLLRLTKTVHFPLTNRGGRTLEGGKPRTIFSPFLHSRPRRQCKGCDETSVKDVVELDNALFASDVGNHKLRGPYSQEHSSLFSQQIVC